VVGPEARVEVDTTRNLSIALQGEA